MKTWLICGINAEMKTFITKELYKNKESKFFTSQLLKWNEKDNKRMMPWKGEKDPYKIWLSEIILQQTRVEQGWAYYEKFIKAFPVISKLAGARDEKVFKLWEGLGYYSRCKNLLFTARQIVNELGGKFPNRYEDIIKLKGIGPYTAAAIASFAYNLPHAVVDGNVMRVLSRYFGITTPVDSTVGKKLFQQVADNCLDRENAGIYNQAIMDFGAVICKPQNPLCHQCPVQKKCAAFHQNKIDEWPVKEKTIKKKERWFYFLVIRLNDKTYVRKRETKDIWENLYEYVSVELPGETESTLFIRTAAFNKIIGKDKFELVSVSKIYKQLLSHQTVYGRFIIIHIKKTLSALKDYWLINDKELKQLPFPRLINNWHDDSIKIQPLF